MELERNYLILVMYGYYMCKYPNSSLKDSIIHLDNHFIAQNNSPLTDEEKKFVDDVFDQVWVSLKIDGLNRKNIRNGIKKWPKKY